MAQLVGHYESERDAELVASAVRRLGCRVDTRPTMRHSDDGSWRHEVKASCDGVMYGLGELRGRKRKRRRKGRRR